MATLRKMETKTKKLKTMRTVGAEYVETKWMAIGPAAAYLGIATGTLYNWTYAGKGPTHYMVGGKRLFIKEDLDAYLENCRTVSSGK